MIIQILCDVVGNLAESVGLAWEKFKDYCQKARKAYLPFFLATELTER